MKDDIELIIADVNKLEEKTTQLIKMLQRQSSDTYVHAIQEVLANPLLKLSVEQRAVLTEMMGSRPARVIGMYVQPDELYTWLKTGRNLLTISRASTFPFTIPLTVVFK